MSNSVQVEIPNETRVLNALLSDQFAGKLEALAQAKAEEYKANTPYPHIYFDDFLPVEVAEAALRDFPEPKEADWFAQTDVNQRKKLAFDVVEKLPSSIRDVLYFLNTRPMLKFLETLTGISSVLPDPNYTGGGLHQIRPGGLLEVHADFSYHKGLRLDRRINVLIYLNKDWKEEYGGHFELWDRNVTRAEKKILPIFNRCAIFSTTSESFHGHPLPLACPPDRNRKSIATYYYTNGRPEEDPELTHKHEVAFQQRPGLHRHEVAFQERPGINSVKTTIRIKKAIHSITPPILTDLYRALRK
jgi:Rps23 Pro-64 3,4-dihydroxylase Tpa1-like proline 4-hydroxylase